jgi:glutaredoxin 3
MSNLKLYTQPNCQYCEILKEKLTEWGYQFLELDVSKSIDDKMFLKDRGHTTVPQLYYKGHHINDVDTEVISEEYVRYKLYPIWTQQV